MVNLALRKLPVLRQLARIVAPVFNTATGRWEQQQLPDLRTLQRSSRFRALDAAAAAWIDANFLQIERHASWLTRAGVTTLDACRTATSPRGAMHRGMFAVTCERSVSLGYAGDGALEARLDQLAEALTRAGWRDAGGEAGGSEQAGVSLAGKEPPARAAWRHADPFTGLPGDMVAGPAGAAPSSSSPGTRVTLQVSWAGRGDPAGPVAEVMTLGPGAETATDLYQPLQVAGCAADELIRQALTGHECVFALRMTAVYYHKGGIAWGASRRGEWP